VVKSVIVIIFRLHVCINVLGHDVYIDLEEFNKGVVRRELCMWAMEENILYFICTNGNYIYNMIVLGWAGGRRSLTYIYPFWRVFWSSSASVCVERERKMRLEI